MATAEIEVKGLDSAEKSKGKAAELGMVDIKTLFQFATTSDYVWLGIALAAETAVGTGYPFMMLFFGEALDAYGDICTDVSGMRAIILRVLYKFLVLGAVLLVLKLISTMGFGRFRENQMFFYRTEYLKAIIRQDVGWYDVSNPQQLSTAFGEALSLIEKGMGYPVWGTLAYNVGQMTMGFALAFESAPLVTLVACSFVPVCLGGIVGLVYVQQVATKKISAAYATSGGVASEALGAMRTVAYLGIEEQVGVRYARGLNEAMRVMVKTSYQLGVAEGVTFGVAPMMVACGFLFGGWQVKTDRIDSEFDFAGGSELPNGTEFCLTDQCNPYDFRFVDPTQEFASPPDTCASIGQQVWRLTCFSACVATSNLTRYGYADEAEFDAYVAGEGGGTSCAYLSAAILVAVFCVNMGANAIGMFPNAMSDLTKARQAAAPVCQTLARRPPIDSFSEAGEKPAQCLGAIEVRDVVFAYPAAPDFPICRGYTLSIQAGQMCALSGPSGSGKSTIVALLERFYDPQAGSIELDGRDIRSLNLGWLRKQMGLVGQEPVLFVGTVAENIATGVLGDATREQVIEAAKVADAHTFISEVLSDGYETQVGQGGSRLSGGQKQRVAIARAMIKKPEILLLDEATSALDNAAERAVQAALDRIRASKKRTTITIAHRLSTIRNSDVIAVVDHGQIVECGSWEQLMDIEDGLFRKLAAKQQEQSHADAALAAELPPAGTRRPSLGIAKLQAAVRKTQMQGRVASFFAGDGERSRSMREPDSPKTPIEEVAAMAKHSRDYEKNTVCQQQTNANLASSITSSNPGARPKTERLFSRLVELGDPGDKLLYGVGVAASALTGAVQPFVGLFEVFCLFALFEPDPNEAQSQTFFWSYLSLGLGVVMTVSTIVEYATYGTAAAHLTRNLRVTTMQKLLRQEVGYFDFEENSAGELSEFLSEKVSLVQSLAGEKLQLQMRMLFMLVSGMIVMFTWGHWAMCLVCIGTVPVMGICAGVQMVAMGLVPEKPKPVADDQQEETESKKKKKKKKGEEEGEGEGAGAKPRPKSAGQIVGEVVLGIRTVASFNAERLFFQQYEEQIDQQRRKAVGGLLLGGFIVGVTQLILINVIGVEIYVGVIMQENGVFGSYEDNGECLRDNTLFYYQIVPILVIFNLLPTMGMMAGNVTDAKAAANAGDQLFARLDRKSARDPSEKAGDIPTERLRGAIEVRDVVFAYPTRPDFPICNGYTLSIKAGQVCALCGPSGSGKSTIINLLERFYDPLFGKITIDGHDITQLNLFWLRQQIGLVGQEPVLFDGTVGENISLGKDGGADMEEIVEAAKAANAHTFISEVLSQGYDTQVGLRGGKLSGGQKQRVAIARAIVRKPSIMLLDEATSALDNESEKIVQAALDELMSKQKKTTITIAHRLSTIRNADLIAVVNKGKIAEQGTHDHLMGLGGIYCDLVQSQAH